MTPPTRTRQSETLKGFIDGSRVRIARLALSSLLGGAAEAVFLVLVARIAFAISEKSDRFAALGRVRLTVGAGILIALALVIARVLFAVLAGAQAARLSSDVVARTRVRLAQGFLRATWPTQQSQRSGQLQELLTTFTLQATAMINAITSGTTALFNLLALLALAVVVNPVGSLVVVVAVPILGSALRPLRTILKHRARRSADVGLAFATRLNEISQLGLEVHVFNVQRPTEDTVVDLIHQTADADRRVAIYRLLVPSIYTGLAYLAVTGALAGVHLSGGTSLVSLGAVMLVMLRSLSYGQGLQQSSAQLSSSLPYLETLNEQIDVFVTGEHVDGTDPVTSVGTIHLDRVSFEYESGRPVLRDLSFTINAGEVVGVVGPSGGGKSTLVQLLLGLRVPTSGALVVDERRIEELSRSDWARRVTFVPQSPRLISGSIADNIRFFRADVSDADVERAARLAHLHDEIDAHPEGFERRVGDGAAQLSGGQAQRLCIARALVEQPDLLILDEPTSALDVQTERALRLTLGELRKTMTIVIVAHRLSTLDICDRIMVIQNGECLAFDTPATLAANNAFYQDALVESGLA